MKVITPGPTNDTKKDQAQVITQNDLAPKWPERAGRPERMVERQDNSKIKHIYLYIYIQSKNI